MSFVRLLSPARSPRSSSPSPIASSSNTQQRAYKPTLSLHVPGYGACLAVASEPNPNDPTEDPQYETALTGELEIRMPSGSGRMRCKSIRVGVRTTLRLDFKGKKREEHELFQTRVEIIGSTSDGVWLAEGSQRFEFTIILPSGLAPQNWVPHANITHDLYAELEGIPEERSTSPFFRQLSLSSFSSGRKSPVSPSSQSSRLPSRSPSPGLDTSRLDNALLSAATSMSITRQEPFAMPVAPTYDESQAVYHGKSLESNYSSGTDRDRWISGTHEHHRTIAVVYNPNPAGTVNQLDERVSSFAPGVGVYEWRMVADEWHIAAWPLFRFILPDPASDVTVFAFRYSLSQTVTITSPSDPTHPHVAQMSFPFVERGLIPPKEAGHPDSSWKALWRGKKAQGKDEGGYKIEAEGQMPKDDVLRPSTLPGVVSPIQVAHRLIAEVFFSVYGEMDNGEKMPSPGPGGLRVMRITRAVAVPSCLLTSQVLNLPTYQPTFSRETTCKTISACKLCGSWPYEILCRKCPQTVIAHLRHDLDPTLVGNKTGQCPLCAGKKRPDCDPAWNICACGLAIEETEERMKAFLLDMDGDSEGRRRVEGMKVEAERGVGRCPGATRPVRQIKHAVEIEGGRYSIG